MLIKVKFFKVIGVPSEPVANAFYFVKNEDETVDMYVTDEDGELSSPGNPAFVIATMASLMALKAPLASPALTGNPTAPTQTAGNNSTRLATTAFVKTAIDNILDAAPGALDTLNELAEALGDDPDFAATMTAALAGKVPVTRTINGYDLSANRTLAKGDIGLGNVDNTSDANKPVSTAQQTALDLKAPLASPALTGNPTAPTQAPGNDTTRLATTAFVQAAIANVIASAPGALDTLDELAAALGDDANFASTVTTALAARELIANRATTTEVLTGTANNKTVTPDALAALWEKGTNLTAAATVTVGEGGYFYMAAGSPQTITDIDFAVDRAGRTAVIYFGGIHTLQHGPNLRLRGNVSITTRPGDVGVFVSAGGADEVEMVLFQRAVDLMEFAAIATPTTIDSSNYFNYLNKTIRAHSSAEVTLGEESSPVPAPPIGFVCTIRNDTGADLLIGVIEISYFNDQNAIVDGGVASLWIDVDGLLNIVGETTTIS